VEKRTAHNQSLHPTRLVVRRFESGFVAASCLVRRGALQTRLAGELSRWAALGIRCQSQIYHFWFTGSELCQISQVRSNSFVLIIRLAKQPYVATNAINQSARSVSSLRQLVIVASSVLRSICSLSILSVGMTIALSVQYPPYCRLLPGCLL